MAVAGTLYTYPENWRAFKALIAAQFSGAKVKVLSAPPQFHFGQTNKTPEFLKKFPVGKVPAFEGDDGFCVFESNAIAYYVSNEELRGASAEAAAQVIQWVSFADSDVVPPASTWVFPTLGIMHYNKQATELAKEEVKRVLGILDAHLRTRTFLVGERITLADITVVCTLLWLYKQVLEPSFRQPYVNTNRWFVTCINQPQFKAVLGEVKLCEKMAQFDAKKFAENQPKKDTPKKEKPAKEDKKQQAPQQQEKKEDKKPAPEDELDECEQALAAEPKTKDPFAHLPKRLSGRQLGLCSFFPPLLSWPLLGCLPPVLFMPVAGAAARRLCAPGWSRAELPCQDKLGERGGTVQPLPTRGRGPESAGATRGQQLPAVPRLPHPATCCRALGHRPAHPAGEVGAWGLLWGARLVPTLRVTKPPSPTPSPFIMDEFKRKYSNEDTLTVALPHFWEHFDKEGWSVWFAEYRFPSELSQTFMSCNLITGMFQRLDKLRKNAFASVILFGTNNDSSISGVWVFRGQELAFPLSPDWQVDYESYTWRKLDPDSEECKTLVKEYFLWEGDFKHVGKAFNQGKIFK